MGIPEGEEKKTGTESIFKAIMLDHFPSLKREIKIHEAKRTPKRLNLTRATPRHIISKLSKVKDKQKKFEVAREKSLPNIITLNTNGLNFPI